ncbi:glucose-6-phosphate isomerase [Candidatus Nitrospira bockiana]
MPTSDFKTTLGRYGPEVQRSLQRLADDRLVPRVWARDHRIWRPDPKEIDDRLGWLTVPRDMQGRRAELRAFADSLRADRVRHVVLLGMGGSSLGPEVLRLTFGSARGYPRLLVLDSTVPGAVRAVTEAIDPAKTLFIVASKSGGTIEVMSLFAHFWALVSRTQGRSAGRQFIAITDPDTSLGALASRHDFRSTFINPPDIGGRYSVLSYFGLVPAALTGITVDTLLTRAVEMAHRCGPDRAVEENPGAQLGTVMGVLCRAGRDKVTVLTSPALDSFGLWVEQLLAESTGKEGTGLIPVVQEPPLPADAYGDDRLFVSVRLDGDANEKLDRQIADLKKARHPVVQLRVRDRYDLGGEFFRWEFATAIAGHYLGIHPFDQPNVQESKDNTKRLLDAFQREGRLPAVEGDETLQELLDEAKPGDYAAILAYVTPSRQVEAALRALRRAIAARYRLATTAGYGPRYLHSTGQLHKGGPNRGLFVELIERMTPDLKIPDAGYTFGTLATAQAVGDVQSLRAHGRPVVAVSLGRDASRDITALLDGRKRRHRPSRVSGSRK